MLYSDGLHELIYAATYILFLEKIITNLTQMKLTGSVGNFSNNEAVLN